MKAKKRAIRRVANVPSLESIGLCGLPEKGGTPVLDLGLGAIIDGVRSVKEPLKSVSKRLCKENTATSRVSIGGASMQQAATETMEEDYTFDVGSQCCYASSGYFEYHPSAGRPVQIRGAGYVCCTIPLSLCCICL